MVLTIIKYYLNVTKLLRSAINKYFNSKENVVSFRVYWRLIIHSKSNRLQFLMV